MIFGHSVDLVFGRTNPEKCEYHLNSEYARNLVLKIEKIHEFAREKLHISFTNMAREYNSKIQQNSYNTGDAVWVFYPNQNQNRKETFFKMERSIHSFTKNK